MNTLLLACCASMLAGVTIRQEPPLLEFTFANGEQGWMVFQPQGDKAKVGLIHDPAHIKVGSASLKYTYSVTSGEISVASVPVMPGVVANMKSLDFWALADHATGLVVTLQEKDGGRFTAIAALPKEKWQEVTLGVSDFNLSTGENDPKDANGKLDTEKIEAIGLVDMNQFLFQNPGLATVANITEGPRQLCLSGFKVMKNMVPDSVVTTDMVTKLDTFARPQPTWMGLGVASLDLATGGTLNEKSLKVDYHIGTGKVCGVVHPFPSGALAGGKTLSIRWATAKPTSYLLQLEEDGGAKYNRTLPSAGGSQLNENTFSLSSLTLSEDSKDANGQLDIGKVHQITLLDLSGLSGTADQDNTLWVGSLSVKR